MSLGAALIGAGIGGFGRKPEVPKLQPVSADAIQKQTAAGNIASFKDIAQLATQVNTFNQDQLDALLDRVLGPGAREQIQSNIQAEVRGELPDSVKRSIYRSNAERGVGVFQGSPFRENINARDVGLTSLDLIDKGLSSAERWISRSAAPQMDVTSMFFTPQQRLALAQQQQSVQFERDMMAAGVKAAPDPRTAAISRELDRMFNTFAQYGMQMLGDYTGASAGGGMGGMGMGGGMGGGGGGSMLMGGGFGGGMGSTSSLAQQQLLGSANGAAL